MRSILIVQTGVGEDGGPLMGPAETPFPPDGAVLVVTAADRFVVYEPGDELPEAAVETQP